MLFDYKTMRSHKKIILLFLFVAFCISDCKKYPDDSKSPHLRTVKERLAGGCFSKGKQWDAGGIFKLSNDSVLAGTLPIDNIFFRKDGFFGGAYDPSNSGTINFPHLNSNGDWEFIDKKNKLSITNSNGGVTSEYTIMKLDVDELWFQNDSLLFKFHEHIKKK